MSFGLWYTLPTLIYYCIHKATLDNLKPNLHPWTIRWCGPIWDLLQKIILSKQSSIVWCHYDYLSAPDQGASPNSNRKYQACLICMTLDRAASDVIPTIANESEQASPTRCCVLLDKTWQPQTCHESRKHHPSFFILYFSMWNRTHARRANLQRWLSSICFSSQVTFDLASLCKITCHCKIVPTIIKCVVSWSGRI